MLSESLDCALEAFTFGNCSSVDLVAFCEDVSLDLVAELVFAFELELADEALAGHAGLGEMSLQGLAYAVFLLILIGDLDSGITVIVHGLDLCHGAGAGQQDRYRSQDTVLVEDLRHSDFGC